MKTLLFILLLNPLLFAQYGDYVSYSRYANYEPQSSIISPTEIANILAWYKADAGITKDGSDNVTAWADQSGNGNTLTQGAGTAPLWVDNEINSLPALNFNAATPERLRKKAPGIGLTGNPNIYVFIVALSSGAGGSTGRAVWIGDSSGAAGTVAGVSFEDEGGTAHPSFRWNNGNERFGNVTVTAFKSYCYNFTTNYGSSVLYVNGSIETETSQGNPTNTVTLTDEEIIIGCGRTTGAAFTVGLTGKIAEIIIYGGAGVTLTTTEISDVFTYLNDRYALY